MLVKVDFKKREYVRKISELKNSNRLLTKDVREISKQIEKLYGLVNEKKDKEIEIETLIDDNKNLTGTLETFGRQLQTLITDLA